VSDNGNLSNDLYKQLYRHCALYTLHCTLCTVHFALYTLHFALCTVHFVLYTVHCTVALYTVHCTLCTVHCTVALCSATYLLKCLYLSSNRRLLVRVCLLYQQVLGFKSALLVQPPFIRYRGLPRIIWIDVWRVTTTSHARSLPSIYLQINFTSEFVVVLRNIRC
jgi:hypothetical protein